MTAPDTTIAIIEKGASTQVRVVLSIWRGQQRLHIREYTPGAIAGQWWPSSKGASLDVRRLPELLDALHQAEAELVILGLLPNCSREVLHAAE